MHDTIADGDIPAPEIGPRLLLQPGKQVEPDLAVRLIVLVDVSDHRGERLNQIGALLHSRANLRSAARFALLVDRSL